MKLRLNAWLPIAGFLAASVALNAYTDSDEKHYNTAPPQLPSDLPTKQVTPSAGPRVNNGWDVAISADFIYWCPRIDGLGYELNGFSSTTVDAGKGSVHHPNWSWEPGFKVGLGFGLGTDGWDLQAEYTWLTSSDKSSQGLNVAGQYPMWNIANNYNNPVYNADDNSPITAAEAKWDFYWNEVDLNLGRNMWLSQYFASRPFVGLKGTWSGTSYNVSYTRAIAGQSDVDFRDRMQAKQTQWGIGVEVGMNNAWHFTQEFSLYADWAVTGLFGTFSIDRKDTEQQVPDDVNPKYTIFNTKNDPTTLKPLLEMGIGLRYETWFADDEYHFLLQAGWEEVYLANYNQFLKLFSESNHGDLSMQGLTIKARFDF